MSASVIFVTREDMLWHARHKPLEDLSVYDLQIPIQEVRDASVIAFEEDGRVNVLKSTRFKPGVYSHADFKSILFSRRLWV